ncbi:3-isopropylmalate dehydratase small subunit [Gloeobacter morelensis]|uniref:3-isopropylmalate dehydratase n=1 Tax=Gloeobacter morelensis MG652769 TaxID=2781736 RepID=A0ABY3PGZ9_9CYAN|nr:3-isopropylmalate dehydratase small subunit [Gloeobacter morelensis]UFP92924.1 3-isopropylmalate dehydratase small subunit [Gloeobacter morelensis MG652769]
MSRIVSITGRAVPLPGDDIDTDRIIPARYLRCLTFDGLGEAVFADDRHQSGGEHPFDAAHHQGASLLLAGCNFGCGSSREHAPQALAKWGIRAIVAESFAEIFFGNCVAIGLPCATARPEHLQQLHTAVAMHPHRLLTLDLEALAVHLHEARLPVLMPTGAQQMFLSGTWDATGQLLAGLAAIRAIAGRLPYGSPPCAPLGKGG